ncbi:hypothetical protein COOONC_16441 [Cooperia oncophora]
MDVSGKVSQYAGTMAAALDVVSIIGCALSVVCLALSLFVFTFFRPLYNVRNTIHRNLCRGFVFESDKTRLFLYYKFSYGFPAAIVAISAGVTWHNYGTDE